MSSALERSWYSHPPESARAKVASAPLWALSLLFGAAARLRGAAYDRGLLAAVRVPGLRVVSVGNLNVGGTGKTPAVIFLAQLLERRGVRAAVLSRGHGRREAADRVLLHGNISDAAEVGDEPLLIAGRCPNVPVLVGRRREVLAARARTEHGAAVALLDDGLQHRRLHRDVDVVVVDEAAGFGNGQLLPRGPLREPLSALGRASLIWLRTSDGPKAPLPRFSAPVVRTRYVPKELRTPEGGAVPTEALRGRRVVAVGGIARPERFAASLRRLGAAVLETYWFADHHPFQAAELLHALGRAQALDAWLVTTEKDAVRLPPGIAAHVLTLEVELLEGASELERVLFGE